MTRLILIVTILVIYRPIQTVVSALDNWEDVHIICPIECVCLQNHFMELSVARWAQGFSDYKYSQPINTINSNEAFYENDTSSVENPILKYTMCMLQENSNIKDLIESLPAGVQVFVLLYKGENKNVTILTSDLAALSDMYILEIRGTTGRELQLIIDEPLPLVQYVNFETIDILGSKFAIEKNNSIHPSQLFDYVPESEKDVYNISLEIKEEIEIVPYEVYVIEQKMAKMATFYNWNQLKVLQIHGCKLDELHWEMFDGLTSLEHLSLEHNDIKVIPPFAFYGAMNIKTLSLARNDILDLNYRALAGLLKLEWLNLSENNLTKLSEITFPPFPKLEWIDFRNNPIKYIFPMTFGVMNNTKKIFIGSKIEMLDLSIGDIFQSLEALTDLQMTNVLSITLRQSMFKGLKSLERLKIQGQIKRIEFDAFSEMPNIRELTLKNCGIQEISMDTFFGVKTLEIVDLSDNNILILPPGLFDDQINIKEIYLQNNQLSALPKTFFNMPSIKLLRLVGNPWICSCDMKLWKQAITNRVRSTKIDKNCTMNVKTIQCNSNHNDYNYIFDNKLSPRCDGGPSEVKHRSVYYSLRKTLKCITATTKTQKIAEKNQKKLKDLNAMHLELYGMKSLPNINGYTWNEKQQRQNKLVMKYKKTARNDLHYLIKTNSMNLEKHEKHKSTIEHSNNI